MKFVTPRDWEATPQFAKLVVECHKTSLPAPRATATYLYFRLWTELAYQMALHQQPGRFNRGNADGFAVMTETPGLPNPAIVFSLYQLADLLKPTDYGWWCEQFASDNHWQGYGWIDGDEKRRILSRWREGNNSARGKCNQTSAVLPEAAWCLNGDGKRISPEQMNAVIVLVRNADATCKFEEREPADFTLGILRAAFAVVASMKPAHIEAVMKRMYYVSRQTRPNFQIPRDPEQLLIAFRELIPIVCPEELWGEWQNSAN